VLLLPVLVCASLAAAVVVTVFLVGGYLSEWGAA